MTDREKSLVEAATATIESGPDLLRSDDLEWVKSQIVAMIKLLTLSVRCYQSAAFMTADDLLTYALLNSDMKLRQSEARRHVKALMDYPKAIHDGRHIYHSLAWRCDQQSIPKEPICNPYGDYRQDPYAIHYPDHFFAQEFSEIFASFAGPLLEGQMKSVEAALREQAEREARGDTDTTFYVPEEVQFQYRALQETRKQRRYPDGLG